MFLCKKLSLCEQLLKMFGGEGREHNYNYFYSTSLGVYVGDKNNELFWSLIRIAIRRPPGPSFGCITVWQERVFLHHAFINFRLPLRNGIADPQHSIIIKI